MWIGGLLFIASHGAWADRLRTFRRDILFCKQVQRSGELNANFDYCAQECLRAESA